MSIADIQSFFEVSLTALILRLDLHSISTKVAEWHHLCAQSDLLKDEWQSYQVYVQAAFGEKLPIQPTEDVFDFYHTPLS
jgi:hypothetical protein